MEKNINEALTPFEELSKHLDNIQTQLETISSKFNDVAEAMKPIKDISNEMSKIQLSDILGIGGFLLDMTGLALASAEMTLTISNSVEDIIDELSDGGESVRKLSKQIGKYIVEGIIEGIKEIRPKLMLIVQELGEDNIIKTVVKEFQISSPSKVMKRIGEYVSEGLGDGIKDGGKHIKAAMGDTTDSIENASKKMSKIKFGLGGLTAVTALVLPLIDYFGDMMRTNETLGRKMEQIWAKITEAFKPVTDAVINLFNQFTTGSEGSVSALDTVLAAVNSAAVVLASVIETIAGFFREYGDEIVTIVKGVWSVISDLVSGAVDVFGGAFDVITGIFTGNGGKDLIKITKVVKKHISSQGFY